MRSRSLSISVTWCWLGTSSSGTRRLRWSARKGRRYISGLSACIRGTIDWSPNTARHRRPDSPVIDVVVENRMRHEFLSSLPRSIAWWQAKAVAFPRPDLPGASQKAMDAHVSTVVPRHARARDLPGREHVHDGHRPQWTAGRGAPSVTVDCWVTSVRTWRTTSDMDPRPDSASITLACRRGGAEGSVTSPTDRSRTATRAGSVPGVRRRAPVCRSMS